jgi:hypothetical protein
VLLTLVGYNYRGNKYLKSENVYLNLNPKQLLWEETKAIHGEFKSTFILFPHALCLTWVSAGEFVSSTSNSETGCQLFPEDIPQLFRM